MSIAVRITLSVLGVWAFGFFFLVRFEVNETKRRYREATEEPLADLSHLLAGLIAVDAASEKLTTDRFEEGVIRALETPLDAAIYDLQKTSTDLHIYVTDRAGIVIFDSQSGGSEGVDFSSWNDVARSLRGEYGARMFHPTHTKASSSVMYVAAPIRRNNEIVGVVSVGKPTANANSFMVAARQSTIFIALTTFATVALISLLLGLAVTRPIRRLITYVRDIRDEKRTALPRLGTPELRTLGAAFDELIQKLEGRRYVERYIQALTHELKSPITAVRGALEVLAADPSPQERERFLNHIENETERMLRLSEKLMTLSTLESTRALEQREEIPVEALLAEVRERVERLAGMRDVELHVECERSLSVEAHRLWVLEALVNMVQNAVEFSPAAGRVEIVARKENRDVLFEVRDCGPGIPDWAKAKVFDRFFSLPRPHTERRSSGLGLSLVREIAELHRGRVTVEDGESGGTVVRLGLPG